MKHHPAAARAVERAAITEAWALMSEPLRIAARDHGYAIALHGSMARDLDLIAVPWVEHGVDTPEELVASLCGVLRGLFGRANPMKEWSDKPHGRRATTIMVWGGWSLDIDLSILPVAPASSEAQPSECEQSEQAAPATADHLLNRELEPHTVSEVDEKR